GHRVRPQRRRLPRGRWLCARRLRLPLQPPGRLVRYGLRRQLPRRDQGGRLHQRGLHHRYGLDAVPHPAAVRPEPHRHGDPRRPRDGAAVREREMTRSEDGRSANVSSESGFTLIEALVAVVVLAVGLISVANLMVVAAASNAVANQATAAATVASQELERLTALPYDQLLEGGDLEG